MQLWRALTRYNKTAIPSEKSDPLLSRIAAETAIRFSNESIIERLQCNQQN